MSRSGYSEDIDETWPHVCWRGAVSSAINGKRGQVFLVELASAMDAMPKKELIIGKLVDHNGECCTIGVLCKSKKIPIENVDCYDPEQVGKAVGIARAMAAEIEYYNDEIGGIETPPQRWVRMRKWVSENIVEKK